MRGFLFGAIFSLFGLMGAATASTPDCVDWNGAWSTNWDAGDGRSTPGPMSVVVNAAGQAVGEWRVGSSGGVLAGQVFGPRFTGAWGVAGDPQQGAFNLTMDPVARRRSDGAMICVFQGTYTSRGSARELRWDGMRLAR